jgi:hypothetical protein
MPVLQFQSLCEAVVTTTTKLKTCNSGILWKYTFIRLYSIPCRLLLEVGVMLNDDWLSRSEVIASF